MDPLFGPDPGTGQKGRLDHKTIHTAQVIRACYLDKADPVQAWKSIYKDAISIKRWLNGLDVKYLHIESKKHGSQDITREKKGGGLAFRVITSQALKFFIPRIIGARKGSIMRINPPIEAEILSKGFDSRSSVVPS